MANEKRLIDANAIPYEEHYVPDGDTQWQYKKELCVLKPTIDAMPTVDAVEVVHGRWIWTVTGEEDYEQYYRCSKCNDHMYSEYNYCPNCGAKMDGDGNGDTML